MRIFNQVAGAVLTRFFVKARQGGNILPGKVRHEQFDQMWKMGI